MAEQTDKAENTQDNQAENISAPQDATKKLKILIFAMAGLVVISIAAMGGVYFAMSGSAESGQETTTSAQIQTEKAKADQASPVVSATPYFYKFLPPFVMNLPTKGRVRFLQIEVEVMAVSSDALKDVETYSPLIKNDLLQLYSSKKYDDIIIPAGREKLRQESLQVVNRILLENTGKESVKQVLFTSFVAQ